MIKTNLQMFAEAPGGGAQEGQTFEINGQQMTGDQLAESYKKLQADHTKVTQKNSELSKNAERVDAWVKFDDYLGELEKTTGQNVKSIVGQQLDGLVQALAQGKAPTQAQMSNLGKQIEKAEQAGDDKTVKRLEELESIAFEAQLEKTYLGFEKSAKEEGFEFKTDEFNEFAAEYMSDRFGIGDDDDFTLKQLQAAYDAFEAKKLKEARKKDIPPLGTSGGAGSPDKKGGQQKVGGLKGAMAAAAKFLGD